MLTWHLLFFRFPALSPRCWYTRSPFMRDTEHHGNSTSWRAAVLQISTTVSATSVAVNPHVPLCHFKTSLCVWNERKGSNWKCCFVIIIALNKIKASASPRSSHHHPSKFTKSLIYKSARNTVHQSYIHD